MKLAIINGPNLNNLEHRDPEIYGLETFEATFDRLKQAFNQVELFYFQSNVEDEMVQAINEHANKVDGIILNAAVFTHTSKKIAHAVQTCSKPVVEVHISRVFAREKFRQQSLIAPHCKGSISGFGMNSYYLAIQALIMDSN